MKKTMFGMVIVTAFVLTCGLTGCSTETTVTHQSIGYYEDADGVHTTVSQVETFTINR